MYTAPHPLQSAELPRPATADEPEETLTHQHVQLFSEQHPPAGTTPLPRGDEGDEPAQSVDAHHPTATEIHLTLFSDR